MCLFHEFSAMWYHCRSIMVKLFTEQQLRLAEKLWGWTPHSKGQEDWFRDPGQFKAAACGRRWGKSESCAIDLATDLIIAESMCRKGLLKERHLRVFAPVMSQALIVFKQAARRLKSARALYPKQIPSFNIDTGHGTIGGKSLRTDLIATGSDMNRSGDTRRGFMAHRAVVDEYAFVQEEFVKNIVVPMLMDVNGQLIGISTTNGKNHFWQYWDNCRRCKCDLCKGVGHAYQFPSSANPTLPRAFLERQEQERGASSYSWRSEYLAEFCEDFGQVFPTSHLQDACVGDGLQQEYIEGHTYVAGIDVAYSNDYLVLVVLDVTTSNYKTAFIDRVTGFSDWTKVADRVAQSLIYYKAETLVDATNMGNPFIGMLEERGANVAGLSMNWYKTKLQMVDQLKRRLDKRKLEMPNRDSDLGEQVWQEFYNFSYYTSPVAGTIRMSAPQGKHDDIVIAYALAVWLCDKLDDIDNDADTHAKLVEPFTQEAFFRRAGMFAGELVSTGNNW